MIRSEGSTSLLRIPSSSNSKLIHASRLLYQHFWYFSLLKCLLPDLPTGGFCNSDCQIFLKATTSNVSDY